MTSPVANMTSKVRRSRFRGDPWAAFDRLPPVLRRAHQEAAINWCSLEERWLLNKAIKAGATEKQAVATLVADLRSEEAAEIQLFANHWPARFGQYPHLGAEASVMRYDERAEVSGRRSDGR